MSPQLQCFQQLITKLSRQMQTTFCLNITYLEFDEAFIITHSYDVLLVMCYQLHYIQKYFQLRFFLKILTKLIRHKSQMGCVTSKQSFGSNKQSKLQTQNRYLKISLGNFNMSNKVSSQNLRLQHSKYQQIQDSKSSPLHDDAEVKNYFSQFLISEIQQEKYNLTSPPFTPFELLDKMQQQTYDIVDSNEQQRISLKNLNKLQHFIQGEISSFEL
ncbi:hypothetical protein pb186bvf_002762 [Paramecium bursaria]